MTKKKNKKVLTEKCIYDTIKKNRKVKKVIKMIKNYLTQNNNYKASEPRIVEGLMLHSTGANNPRLSRYIHNDTKGLIGENPNCNHWNTPTPGGREVCVNGFIGLLSDDTTVDYVNTLPYDVETWHCGGLANKTHIGIEICEGDKSDFEYFNKAYYKAVDVFADLCLKFELNPWTDIISHKEGCAKGLASNHGDPESYFKHFKRTMYDFRKDVERTMKEKDQCPSAWAVSAWKKAIDKKIIDGTNPKQPMTREQVIVVLERLGLI